MFSFTRKGIKFPRLTAEELKIHPWPEKGRLTVPLCPASGEKMTLAAEAGQRVEKYGLLAQSPDSSVYSPCSGQIVEFCAADTVSFARVPCAVIEPDEVQPGEGVYDSAAVPDAEQLLLACRSCGVVDMIWNRPAAQVIAEGLRVGGKFLIAAIDDGPDTASAGAVLLAYFREIVSAAGWLARQSGAGYEILTDNPFVKAKIKSFDPGAPVKMAGRRYPVLFYAKRYARETQGTLLSVFTLLALFYAAAFERPMLSAFVSVSGPGQPVPKVFRVPVGTPLVSLVQRFPEQREQLCVTGGLMNGTPATRDTVITPECTAVTVIKRPIFRYDRCVSCGLCVRVCPAGVAPSFVYEMMTGIQPPADYGAQNCIGCGSCSYICPAGIPLAEIVMAAATAEPGRCDDE